MTKLLLKLFIKGDIAEKRNREKCGTLGSFVGILSNLLLFIIKLIAGIISGSVAIIADAFNNLSDMGSSIVTLLGFKIASKPADPEHPFGHGRMEYLSAATVSVLIIIVGIELVTSSAEKLASPTLPEAKAISIAILIVSILIKLWMSLFNRKLGKAIDSSALLATSTDSLNDCISTGAVLAVSIISLLFKEIAFVKHLDPVVGIAVAAFIVVAGVKSLKETLDPLIGLAPDPEVVKEIQNIVMANENFLGIHDMIVHNYGPGRSFVSLHVEVPYDVDILECHEQIDRCERDIFEKTNVEAVIHMDPIVTDDEDANFAKESLLIKLKEIDERITMHDFRMVKGTNQNNLIFDVCIPAGLHLSPSQLKQAINAMAKDIDKTYACVITVDQDLIGNIR